jgi:hypothetical protein
VGEYSRFIVFENELLRAPPKIHSGVQANLFDSGRRQEKAALVLTKADFPSLPECKDLLLSAQKQFLELPLLNAAKPPIDREKVRSEPLSSDDHRIKFGRNRTFEKGLLKKGRWI